MAESKVKVGVRIRPLLPKEKGQNVTFASYDKKSVSFKGQTYTFDHVFGMELSQYELYAQTAAPMLKSFMEGYNCTIMAYGQTGSGKTFSMGTSDIAHQDTENQGLISRFVTDLFGNLDTAQADGELISYQVKASYLEIYGEDVFDLLPADNFVRNGNGRVALHVREDEGGKILVQGLNEHPVSNVASTLELLSSGARHRITASTAMNAESSRSHSVFTLQLEQSVRGSGIGGNGASSDEEVQVLCAKLTFVDLAGSERIKRTGAEGQRLKEGIQINSGLFNLGQVINSLADEQKLKSGQAKANHVPYRNSKLTHLLKDALGGNSQTLFLACVSPAESNESETQSTLQYAKQARNIQNKPVQNVDKVQRELQRLRAAVKVWTMRAVTATFGTNCRSDAAARAMLSAEAVEKEALELMSRPDVSDFVAAVNGGISEKSGVPTKTAPRKVRISTGAVLSPSPMKGAAGTARALYSPVRPIRSNLLAALHGPGGDALGDVYSPPCSFPGVNGAYMSNGGRQSILTAFPSLAAAASEGSLLAAEPEETERLLARMMDMVHKEKQQLMTAAGEDLPAPVEEGGASATGTAEEGDEAALASDNAALQMQLAHSEDIAEMDRTIQEKEEILLKLQETVKGYAVMKCEFEKLLGAINGLEEEKQHLEAELERAKRLAEHQGSTGAGAATNGAAYERIKERFAKVTSELKQMRDEKRNKESAFRLMQRENKQCETLQRELKKLKESRVQMAKQQKAQALQVQKLKKDQIAKAIQFKKADVKKQQLVNTLKSELVKKERVLGIKDREIARVTMKLKVCEEHVVQLLKLQNKARNAPAAAGKAGGAGTSGPLGKAVAGTRGKVNLPAGEAEHLQSSKAMLEHMLMERLDRHVSRIVYEQKTLQLAELNREMEGDAALLEELLAQKKELVADMRARGNLPAAASPAASPDQVTEEGGDADAVGADEVGYEEEVDLAQLCGAANNGLSEEEKYHISQLKTSIEMTENSLERLTKEVDICNADLDELSLSMEAERGKTAAGRPDPDAAWEEMGRDIVAGLSQGQSHTLLLDLMNEKLKTLEQLRVTHNLLARTHADLEQEADKNQELTNWVTALRAELKTRLERAEKLRVGDMWALMLASSGNAVAGDAATVAAREEAASRIAVLRAQELERELEIALSAEDSLKEELQDRARVVRELQRKVSELTLRAEFGDSEATWTEVGDHAGEGKREKRSSLAPVTDSYMDQLFAVWEELGLPEQERAEALEYVQKSRALAKQRAVVDVQTHLGCVKKEIEDAKETLGVLSAAVGRPAEQLAPELGSGSTTLLLPQLAAIKAGIKSATEEIEQKFPSLSSAKDRLTEVMSEMWLEIHDLTPALRPLAKLVLSPSGGVDATDGAAVSVGTQMAKMKVSLQSIATWESEIKKLNLLRVQVTSKLIAVRDAALKLLGELQLKDVKAELSGLMKGVALSTKTRDSDADDQLSAQAVSAAVQILVANSASNPPGSQKLLAALERVELVLGSVKVNRSTVAQTAARLVSSYIQHFPQETDSLLLTGVALQTDDAAADAREVALSERKALLQRAVDNGVCSGPDVTDTFAITQAVCARAKDLRATLSNEVCAILSEVNPAVSGDQGKELVGRHLSAVHGHQGPATEPLVQGMVDTVEELEGLEMFVEEGWVQAGVQGIVRGWEAGNLPTIMTENAALWAELQRLQGVGEAHRELVRADQALRRHVQEMDDFEEKSRQDRAKALSGNSRLLVEEEKFRKAGKKKYEQLSERMLQLFGRLNSLTTGLTAPHIDTRPSLEGLSAKGKGLLKGRFKERIELMHLQLSTGPAAAAAASANPPGASPTGIPVLAAASSAGKNAPGPAKKSSGSAVSGAGHHHNVVTNVFDFATADHPSSAVTSSGVSRSSNSHDLLPTTEKGSAGRVSSGNGGDKENVLRGRASK